MISRSDHSNEPNFLRHIFPSHRVPRASFAEDGIPISVPQAVSCLDSTLALGALALQRPTIEQVIAFAELLERLENRSGLLRRLEVLVDPTSGRDQLAALLEHRQARDLQLQPVALLPHPTAELIASLKGLELREAGLMVAASDFHRDSLDRTTQGLIRTIEACLALRIQPRLDMTDATRADVEGFLLPVVDTCMEHLARLGAGQLRLRLCDTLGLGIPWSEAPVPRSVPRVLRLVGHTLGLQPAQLEFVGSNDLGLALANTISASLHGCGTLVCSVGGVGERSGIAPLEQALIHLSGLFGADCDLTAVTELLALLSRQLGLKPGRHHPLWGEAGLTTCLIPSGLPLEETLELYAPFDTARLIGRMPEIEVRPESGTAGIAHLLRQHLPGPALEPDDAAIIDLLAWIAAQGLTGPLSWEVVEPGVRELWPGRFEVED